MTFPFSGEFKFNLLKATREDDMTSSTIKNLNGDVCTRISLHFHSFFFVQQNAGKCILSNRKERRNMTLKYPGILNVICNLKLRGSFENYLQKVHSFCVWILNISIIHRIKVLIILHPDSPFLSYQ